MKRSSDQKQKNSTNNNHQSGAETTNAALLGNRRIYDSHGLFLNVCRRRDPLTTMYFYAILVMRLLVVSTGNL
jgi:hypothetical protein